MQHNEQQVRERAYQLWDAAGRPEGRADEFWEMATRDLASPADERGDTTGSLNNDDLVPPLGRGSRGSTAAQ